MLFCETCATVFYSVPRVCCSALPLPQCSVLSPDLFCVTYVTVFRSVVRTCCSVRPVTRCSVLSPGLAVLCYLCHSVLFCRQDLLFCETCDTVFCALCTETGHGGLSDSCEHTIVPFSIAIKRMSEILLYKANECISKVRVRGRLWYRGRHIECSGRPTMKAWI